MELNDLEKAFFDQILNAELDVPVHATLILRDGEEALDIVATPQIDTEGYFTLKYTNATAFVPDAEDVEEGASLLEYSMAGAASGQHPSLRRAWLNREDVMAQLHQTPLPVQRRESPELDAKVQLAGPRNRGKLRLDKNEIKLREAKLERAEFCILGFTRFFPRQFGICLGTPDGWKVILEEDDKKTRGLVSHTGKVARNDGRCFSTDELNHVMQGLVGFFSFSCSNWISPTVVVGYDSCNWPVWGKIGRLNADRLHPSNWFRNARNAEEGVVLEAFFPRFWCCWQKKGNEVSAAIHCYVDSYRMLENGLQKDAIANKLRGSGNSYLSN